MPQLWKSLHKHWARPSTDEEVKRSSGTTTSSAFSMLCPARTSCDRYRPSSVNIASLRAALSFGQFPGNSRGRTKSNFRRCWITDIPDIVELSFASGVFTAAGKCRFQIEGTCIGNQISPILSGLPVLMAEKKFLESLPTTLSSSFVFLRYVDNRLLLGPTATLESEQLTAFCDPTFTMGSCWNLGTSSLRLFLSCIVDSPVCLTP